MTALNDIGRWLWRLLPGNPILLRVVAVGSKRPRHLLARVAYLVALLAVFLLGGGLLLGGSGQTLADLAKQATRSFMNVSIVQLFLMSFIAPVFCAGAITQEKDANTYHILLTTPLTNGQIVLGTLFSRLFFVWALLLAGLPIFCVTMVYGGVTTAEIFESFGLAACTGLITGSIAITLSFLRIGTPRTLFAFFAGVAIYLLGVGLAGLSSGTRLPEAPPGTGGWTLSSRVPPQMSWLAPLHPLLALLVVTGQTPAPPLSDVYHYGWPARWLLAYPQYGYMALTTLASAAMVVVSLFFVRRGAREGENRLWNWLARHLPRRSGERRRKVRRVWRNPIAWREAQTRASAGGRSLLRPVFVVAGVLAGGTLFLGHYGGWWGLGAANPGETRFLLTVFVWLELAVILLVVTNTAATTLTREKEAQTMELLLATPLTSRYIVAGMLQGLVRLALPLIAVPTGVILAFAAAGLLAASPPVAPPEAVIGVPLLMTSFAALAAMIGLHFSLVSRKTVKAVMTATAVVLGAAGLLSACGAFLSDQNSLLAAVLLPFTPFPAVQAVLDPWSVLGRHVTRNAWGGGPAPAPSVAAINSFRTVAFTFSLVGSAVYLGITYAFHKGMVRNFDMIVRRQAL